MSHPVVNQSVTGSHNIFTGSGDVKVYNLPPAEAEEYRNLLVLLRRVEQFWIGGVLEKSVHTEALLDIDKDVEMEAIEHPWESVLERPDRSTQAIPANTKISEVFDEVGRLLLILGDPGSGKTISLLELTRDLIAKSKYDPGHPIPVIFNLSTWSTKYRRLASWLIEELKAKYFIPRHMGQSWLKSNRLILLLDGLDEVRAASRSNCVDAINAFVQDFGLPGIVVCSRIGDYMALPVRLRFNAAIRLKPLTLERIDKYLASVGPRLAALRAILDQDNVLQTLARSPLMLSMMSIAYRDKPFTLLVKEDINTPTSGYQYVFDVYVQRMFERRRQARWASLVQAKHWLSWLAHKMRQHSETVFLIEHLQPTWLSTSFSQKVYTFASRLLAALAASFFVALTSVVITIIDSYSGARPTRMLELIVIFLVPMTVGFTVGSIAGIKDFFSFFVCKTAADLPQKPSMGGVVKEVLTYALIWTCLTALLLSVSGPLSITAIPWLLAYGLVFGIVQWFIFGSRYASQSLANDIGTYETFAWSWSKALKSTLWGIVIVFGLSQMATLGSFLIAPANYWTFENLLGALLLNTLTGAFIGGPIGTLFGGFTTRVVETKASPNQGIRLTIRNAVFAGLIIGVVIGLIAGIGIAWLESAFSDVSGRVEAALLAGSISGSIVAVSFGGFDAVKHYVLRVLLILNGSTPRRFARFLDHSANLILLQKVGGGYIFIHGLLLKHFAELSERQKQL